MTELIVALDGLDLRRLRQRLAREAGVGWFKVGPLAMLDAKWPALVRAGGDYRVFLDLKLADTRRTVQEAVKSFADVGVAAVSTFTEAATVAAARAAEGSDLRVWCVVQLTDDLTSGAASLPWGMMDAAHGFIVPGARVTDAMRERGKDIVVPGVRLDRTTDDDYQHIWMTDADKCPGWGVTHAVVGRPIWQAADPIAPAREYIEALR